MMIKEMFVSALSLGSTCAFAETLEPEDLENSVFDLPMLEEESEIQMISRKELQKQYIEKTAEERALVAEICDTYEPEIVESKGVTFIKRNL